MINAEEHLREMRQARRDALEEAACTLDGQATNRLQASTIRALKNSPEIPGGFRMNYSELPKCSDTPGTMHRMGCQCWEAQRDAEVVLLKAQLERYRPLHEFYQAEGLEGLSTLVNEVNRLRKELRELKQGDNK